MILKERCNYYETQKLNKTYMWPMCKHWLKRKKNAFELKSPSPIRFINSRLSIFAGKEFLVKIYKHLQNYAFELNTFSKILFFWSKWTICFIVERKNINDKKKRVLDGLKLSHQKPKHFLSFFSFSFDFLSLYTVLLLSIRHGFHFQHELI